MSAPKAALATVLASEPVPSIHNDPRLTFPDPEAGRLLDRIPFGFAHNLSGLDLFQMESLLRLADTFASYPRDYYVAGSAPTPGTSFYNVSAGGYKPREAIEKIEKLNCRVLLKRPETHSKQFRELVDELIRQVIDFKGGLGGERIQRLDSAVIVSSGSTTTPIHFDPEMGFFSQIEGPKEYHVFEPSTAPEEALEQFYVRGRLNIGTVDLAALDPAREHVFHLGPGKGMHQPQNAPHWVRTGGGRSISFTFVYQTNASYARGRTRAFNFCIRKIGIDPVPLGVHPGLDATKAVVMRGAYPVQFAVRVANRIQHILSARLHSGN